MSRHSHEIVICTLSPECDDRNPLRFEALGVKVISLGLSRLAGVVKGRYLLNRELKKFQPHIVHSQGLRADGLMGKLRKSYNWVTTARNYPHDDYPAKFGVFRGTIMALMHLSFLRKCNNLVSCSDFIRKCLGSEGILATTIRNGVPFSNHMSERKPQFDFVYTGSLIERKNVRLLVELFVSNPSLGSLCVVGDGPIIDELRIKATGSQVEFVGDVDNVYPYLLNARCFISLSHSEGMPNSVLEALSCGLPVVLSNIPSHIEINSAGVPGCFLIDYKKLDDTANSLKDARDKSCLVHNDDIISVSRELFSSDSMARSYEIFYEGLCNGEV
jgi:glycosyltransferase involved in cell wall biosynthesis